VAYDWDFGDGAPHSTNQAPNHTYDAPGFYVWTVLGAASSANAIDAGIIVVGEPVSLNIIRTGTLLNLSWPNTLADTLLEGNPSLGSDAPWQWITNTPSADPGFLRVQIPASDAGFFRVRRTW
jgi:PKD repeat protein